MVFGDFSHILHVFVFSFFGILWGSGKAADLMAVFISVDADDASCRVGVDRMLYPVVTRAFQLDEVVVSGELDAGGVFILVHS